MLRSEVDSLQGNPCDQSWRRKEGYGGKDLQKSKVLSLEWRIEGWWNTIRKLAAWRPYKILQLNALHNSWVVNKPLRLSFACELTRRSVRAKRGSQFIVCLCTAQCAMRFRLVDFVLQSISRCSLCVASRAIRCSIAVVLVKWAKRRTSKWACTVFQKETQLFLLTSANVHRLL